jgi:hypothetical protein
VFPRANVDPGDAPRRAMLARKRTPQRTFVSGAAHFVDA